MEDVFSLSVGIEEQIVSLLNGKTATALGTLSSVVSLILTILVYIGIKNIRNFYIFTARVPQLIERIAEKSSLLNDKLTSFGGMTVAIRELLIEVEALLTSLSKSVDGQLRKEVLALLKDIKAVDNSNASFWRRYFPFVLKSKPTETDIQQKNLADIYISLYRILAICSARHEDARWEK